MMSFKEFIDAYRDGSIENNITWRGYDLKNAILPSHTNLGIRLLGYKYAKEHAISTIQADYGIASVNDTKALLGYWWLLYRMSMGNAARIKIRQPIIEPAGGGLQPREGSAWGVSGLDPLNAAHGREIGPSVDPREKAPSH